MTPALVLPRLKHAPHRQADAEAHSETVTADPQSLQEISADKPISETPVIPITPVADHIQADLLPLTEETETQKPVYDPPEIVTETELTHETESQDIQTPISDIPVPSNRRGDTLPEMAQVRINRQKKARFNETDTVQTRAQLQPRMSGRDKSKRKFFGCLASSKEIWSNWGDTTVQYQCFHTTVKQAMSGLHHKRLEKP
jgi:hypothetical protein